MLEFIVFPLFLGLTSALVGKLVAALIVGAAGYGAGRLANKYGHMSLADSEAANLSLRNQQELNQQEYDRKLDFYNRFESPAAQVAQYKAAGLNPMMLGSGSIVSASGGIGSAGSAAAGTGATASPDSLNNLLSTILNYKVESQRNKILADQSDSVIFRNMGSGSAGFATADEKRVLVDEKKSQLQAETQVLKEEVLNKRVQRQLAEKNISKTEADTLLTLREKALKEVQLKYNDKYWENVVALQELQKKVDNATIARDMVSVRMTEQQIKNLQIENDNMLKEGVGLLISNGKAAHELDILSAEAANAERRIKLENTQAVVGMVTDGINSVVGIAGAASGVGSAAAALRTAGAAASRASTYDYDVHMRNSRPRRGR